MKPVITPRYDSSHPVILSIEDDKLIELIRIAEHKNIINKRLSKLSHEIRKAANKVLHLKEDDIKLAEDEVMKTIRDTVEVVEHVHK